MVAPRELVCRSLQDGLEDSDGARHPDAGGGSRRNSGRASDKNAAIQISASAVARVGLFLWAIGAALAIHGQVLVRQPNSTLNLPLAPNDGGAALSFSVQDAFPGLTFNNPVAIASPPGETDRLFVVERPGRIKVINHLANPVASVFLDITDRVYSDYYQAGSEGINNLEFHPNYAQNGYFYVVYCTFERGNQGIGPYVRLSRFQVSSSNPNQANPNSEQVLLNQRHQGYGHDWDDVKFGKDGYLYVALGDEGDPDDIWHNSQRIDKNFYSGIIRIDVDNRPGNLPPNPHPAIVGQYSIPADNPYIGATNFADAPVNPSQVRTEFYAVGLRNPYRMSFDPVTGELYAADVGEHAWEEIDRIVKGGNYGWAYYEGTGPGFRGVAPPGVVMLDPILEYGHGSGLDQGNCIIGGVTYRGRKWPQLNGRYFFGDYVDGNIWSTQFSGQTAAPMENVAAAPGIAGFGIDPSTGDILMANHDQNKIQRLAVAGGSVSNLPATLADTGAFKDLTNLIPADGIVPYDVDVPFWSDGALKRRWFYVPQSQTIQFHPDQPWTFPSGSLWIKEFDLEMTAGDPSSRRRVETRFLVKNDSGVYGITYRWGDSQQNASLVPAAGMDQAFQINQNGQTMSQTWHYPARNECLTCHTSVAGYVLGFNTFQLNKAFSYPGGAANQLAALKDAGYFSNPPAAVNPLRALAPADDSQSSVEYRVRSYLAANCAQCHQPGGPGQGSWDARITQPLSAAGLINGPVIDAFGNPNARVVAPGSPQNSILYSRVANFGPGHMPPLATTVLNRSAINLLQAWITGDLTHYESYAQWQVRYFGSTNNPDSFPQADPDHDGAVNYLEYLTHRNPLDPSDAWRISIQSQNGSARISFPQVADRWFQVQSTTDLANPQSWLPLDAPSNHPIISAADFTAAVADPIGSSAKFYRVQVREP